jgi:hypothetical protein
MVACEASGAREHGHDSKQEHQAKGPIMQAKEWTRGLGGATSGARRHKSHKGEMIVLGEKNRATGARTTPGRLAQAGRPAL